VVKLQSLSAASEEGFKHRTSACRYCASRNFFLGE